MRVTQIDLFLEAGVPVTLTLRQIKEIERLLERRLTPQERIWLWYADKVAPMDDVVPVDNVVPFPESPSDDEEEEKIA